MKRIFISLIVLLLCMCGCSSKKKLVETTEKAFEKTEEAFNELEEYVSDIAEEETPVKEVETGENEVEIEEEVEESTEEVQEVTSEGIRPEVKEALDTYETFMNDYCDFMKRYAESGGTDMGLLADYAKYIGDYADMTQKINDIEGTLNSEELQYYTQVILRCEQKLLEVAQ